MTMTEKRTPLDIVLIGDNYLGKSSLFNLITNNEHYIHQTSMNFGIKEVVSDGFRLKLQIWDTTGPERFQSWYL